MSEPVIKRDALAELLPTGDGRTVDVRIIPYNSVHRVTDNRRDFYEEEWLPGAFDDQTNAAFRVDVLANFEHQPGIQNVVGRGTELRDVDNALEGTFRMLDGPDGDKALHLINEGVLTGVSLEAEPRKTVRNGDGVIQRVKARLVNIAFCRNPAFPTAEVLAVREGAEEPEEPPAEEPPVEAELGDDPAPEPEPPEEPAPDPERSQQVNALLERIGYEPLISRAVTKKPWDGSAARFDDAQYRRSCLIDRGGDAPVKERCSLPVLEPNGDINANALGAAAGRLNQVQASAQQKAAAARKLIRYYNQASMEPPSSLRAMASR